MSDRVKEEDRRYYVICWNGKTRELFNLVHLAGPFESEEEAEGQESLVRDLVAYVDPNADEYRIQVNYAHRDVQIKTTFQRNQDGTYSYDGGGIFPPSEGWSKG